MIAIKCYYAHDSGHVEACKQKCRAKSEIVGDGGFCDASERAEA